MSISQTTTGVTIIRRLGFSSVYEFIVYTANVALRNKTNITKATPLFDTITIDSDVISKNIMNPGTRQ